MSADVSKRSAAEARRQKLLARGKDRLQQITQGPTPSKRCLVIVRQLFTLLLTISPDLCIQKMQMQDPPACMIPNQTTRKDQAFEQGGVIRL